MALALVLLAPSATAHEYPDTVRVKVGEVTTFDVTDAATCSATVYWEALANPALATIEPDQNEGVSVEFTVRAATTPGITTFTIQWIGEDVGAEGPCNEDTRDFGGVEVVLRVTPDEVNAPGDGGDYIAGDGHCDTGEDETVGGEDQPQCTLRAAIEEANGGGDALVTFASHITEISPTHTLPAITRALTIRGPAVSGRGPPGTVPVPQVVLVGRSSQGVTRGLIVEAGGAGTRIERIGVRSFNESGLFIRADGVVVTGCHLWSNGIHGVFVTDAENVTIGGSSAAEGNLIYANEESGVTILRGRAASVLGNRIGLDPAGNPAGNIARNVSVLVGEDVEIGAPAAAAGEAPGNRIAASPGEGVSITDSQGTVVVANLIGTAQPGPREAPLTPAGNQGVGLQVQGESPGTIIGGTGSGAKNLIVGNGRGIVVSGDPTTASIRRNEIYRNAGLAIDLGDDGPTANDFGALLASDDPDTGPNALLNFPAGITASADRNEPDKWTLSGRLDTPSPQTATVEIYSSRTPSFSEDEDATRFGDLESFVVSTQPNANGFIRVVVLRADVPFPILSATATDTEGRTSEVSWVCLDPDGDGSTDSDNDGLCDDWEMATRGIDYDGDNTVDLNLASTSRPADQRASPTQPDLFVEYDWMRGSEPVAGAFPPVVAAFAASPRRIALHVERGEETRAFDPIAFGTEPNAVTPGGSFADIKDGNPVNPCGAGINDGRFGTPEDRVATNCRARLGARALVYRYALFGQNHAPQPRSSGIAELPGNDFMVTVSAWSERGLRVSAGLSGSTGQLSTARARVQGVTFMHEMGHTLRLGHGGSDFVNCKPNYPSIMSYALQFQAIVSSRVLDYSRVQMLALDERALLDSLGLRGPANRQAAFRDSHGMSNVVVSTGLRQVDWNGDGVLAGRPSFMQDLNNLKRSCGGAGLAARPFDGANDWTILTLDFRGSLDYQTSGATNPASVRRVDELYLTESELIAAAEETDYDGDGLVNADDNCAAIANPDQADVDENGIGDACEGPLADVGVIQESEETAGGYTFRLQVFNFGPEAATDVVVTDTLAAGLTASAIDAPGATCTTEAQVVQCTYASVAAGDSLAVRIDATGEAGAAVVAAVSYTYDPNPTNNRSATLFSGATAGEDGPDGPADARPDVVRLSVPSPNPTRGQSTLTYDLTRVGPVRIEVFDLWGRRVATLVDGTDGPGRHTVAFESSALPAGVYVIRLEAEGQTLTARSIVVR